MKRVRWGHGSMDCAFADAVIQFALWRDPARVCGLIANVTRELEARGYSAEEIAAAIEQHPLWYPGGTPAHSTTRRTSTRS